MEEERQRNREKYIKHRETMLSRQIAYYYATREERLAYQSVYDKARRASGWKYVRKTKRVRPPKEPKPPKPAKEPKPPKTPRVKKVKEPKPPKPPKPIPITQSPFKEASFIISFLE
jgi:hypothetical protein